MKSEKSYAELQQELDEIIAWFESDEVDIESSLDKYKQGQLIIDKLKSRLAKAELEIKKISQN
ncbi:MAG: exodeoxyribonuclease VII small subunit [bacterium]|nr:exodeoxyribonuclease VII small subunit [bacterium]